MADILSQEDIDTLLEVIGEEKEKLNTAEKEIKKDGKIYELFNQEISTTIKGLIGYEPVLTSLEYSADLKKEIKRKKFYNLVFYINVSNKIKTVDIIIDNNIAIVLGNLLLGDDLATQENIIKKGNIELNYDEKDAIKEILSNIVGAFVTTLKTFFNDKIKTIEHGKIIKSAEIDYFDPRFYSILKLSFNNKIYGYLFYNMSLVKEENNLEILSEVKDFLENMKISGSIKNPVFKLNIKKLSNILNKINKRLKNE